MFIKKIYISVLFTLANLSAYCQSTENYTSSLVQFNKGVELFDKSQYVSAKIIFDTQSVSLQGQMATDCVFYSNVCALRLQQHKAAERMEQFIRCNPTSSKIHLAQLELAFYFFEKKDYPSAMRYFETLSDESITDEEKDKINFYTAYTYYENKDLSKAKVYFNKVLYSTTYSSQANYYLGYIAYNNNEYTLANQYFSQVENNTFFKEKLYYYQADIAFKQANFKQAIILANKAIESSSGIETSELNKIIGESFFNLKQYKEAIPYLTKYAGKQGKWTTVDFYILGYAYYKQNDFQNAIAQFSKIISENSGVAQNAYYHLGESYLKTNKKQQALHAFKNASEMNFDLKIQEDASLNYARLSYEIGNTYESVPVVLHTFLTKYPSHASVHEINTLLIDSYISSKNYKEALALLEKNNTFENKAIFQKVAFYNAIDSYNQSDFKRAKAGFEQALTQQKDFKTTARATFWKAETEYVLNDFKNALLSYKQFLSSTQSVDTPEFKTIYYNIAYTHFKLKEYDQAAAYFQKFIQDSTPSALHLNDAYLRLADCLFVTSKYQQAINAYEKALKGKEAQTEYAFYQKAIAQGFIGNDDKKISELNAFVKKYPTSSYRDDALYEIAKTHTKKNQSAIAIATYNQLIEQYPSSGYTSKAILNQGLIYYNDGREEQAIEKLKKVATVYAGTEEANDAVKTVRLIYLEKGAIEAYTSWVQTLKMTDISQEELQNDAWQTAEKQYMQENNQLAITNLLSYHKNFPNTKHTLKANFYLANLYFKQKEINKATPFYEYVIAQPKNEFTEQSLTRLTEIYIKKQDNTNSIIALKRLESEAEYPQNKIYATVHLMRLLYNTNEPKQAAEYANKILLNDTDSNLRVEAQVTLARTAILLQDETTAREAYLKVQKSANGELMAEALYYDAYFKNKDLKYEASNLIVQKIAKTYSSYKYYGAKSLIIMAKNFYGLKDSFQATYILESVIKNFSNFTDVVAQAQAELNKIKTEESKTNASITK